jgi:Lrp/AsnC family transcriptional regulator, leucine-responsive regulatory protein
LRRPELDPTDHRLLALLQRDCSTTLFDLGQQVGLSTSAVQRRISRYREAGLLDRQVAVLNPSAFPEVVHALVMVTLERDSTERRATMRARLSESSAVQQCYGLAGEYDFAVLVAARGMNELLEVVDDLFVEAPWFKRFDTFPIYRVVKAGLEIPTE